MSAIAVPPTPFLPRLPGGRHVNNNDNDNDNDNEFDEESMLADMTMGSVDSMSGMMTREGDATVLGIAADEDGHLESVAVNDAAEEGEEEESTPRPKDIRTVALPELLSHERGHGQRDEVEESVRHTQDDAEDEDEYEQQTDDTLPSPFLKLGRYPARSQRPGSQDAVFSSRGHSAVIGLRDALFEEEGEAENRSLVREERTLILRDMAGDLEQESWIGDETMGMSLAGETPAPRRVDLVHASSAARSVRSVRSVKSRFAVVDHRQMGKSKVYAVGRSLEDGEETTGVAGLPDGETDRVETELDATVLIGRGEASTWAEQEAVFEEELNSSAVHTGPRGRVDEEIHDWRTERKKRDPPTPPRRERSSSSMNTPQPLVPGSVWHSHAENGEQKKDDFFKRRLVDSARRFTHADYAGLTQAMSSPGVHSVPSQTHMADARQATPEASSVDFDTTAVHEKIDNHLPPSGEDVDYALAAQQNRLPRPSRLPPPRRLMPPTPAPVSSVEDEESDRLASEAEARFMALRRKGSLLPGRKIARAIGAEVEGMTHARNVGKSAEELRGDAPGGMGGIGGLLARSSIFARRAPHAEAEQAEELPHDAEAEGEGGTYDEGIDAYTSTTGLAMNPAPASHSVHPSIPDDALSATTPSRTGVVGFFSGFLRRSASAVSLGRSRLRKSLDPEENEAAAGAGTSSMSRTSLSASEDETRLGTPSVRSEELRQHDEAQAKDYSGHLDEVLHDGDVSEEAEEEGMEPEQHQEQDHSGEVSDLSFSSDPSAPASSLPKAASRSAFPLTLPPLPHIPGYRPLTVPRLEGTGHYASSTVARAGAPSAPGAKGSVRSRPRGSVSSAFAAQALARLPPPGQGSSRAGEKVTLNQAEKAVDVRRRKEGWEKRAAAAAGDAAGRTRAPLGESKTVPQSSATLTSAGRTDPNNAHGQGQALKRTVPVVGVTPGKGTALRAAKRRAFDEARKEREEMDRLERAAKAGSAPSASARDGKGVRV